MAAGPGLIEELYLYFLVNFLHDMCKRNGFCNFLSGALKMNMLFEWLGKIKTDFKTKSFYYHVLSFLKTFYCFRYFLFKNYSCIPYYVLGVQQWLDIYVTKWSP